MAKPSVDTLLADPDFQRMDVEGQREILGEVSSSFKALSPEVQNNALSDIRALSSTALPEVVVTAEAIKEPAGTGQFPETSQPLGALARGALSTLTADLSEALPNRGGDLSAFDPASPQFTNPYSTMVGEIAGGFLPLGELIKGAQGAKTLGQAVLSNAGTGARLGGLYGAASGAAESAAQPDIDAQQTLENILTGTAVGIPTGAIGGGLIPAAAGGIQRLPGAIQSAGRAIPAAVQSAEGAVTRAKARVAPATVQQNAMAALDFTADEVNRHIPVVSERVTQITGEVPTTAKGAIEAMKRAENQLYEDRILINEAATQEGLVAKGDIALQAANEILNPLTTVTDVEKRSILTRLQNLYSGDKTIEEGQKIQQDLNKKFSAAYENGTIDRADPAFQAEKAIRDSFADQMDEISRTITRRDESPYSEIGSLIEVRGALQEKLNTIEGREAARKTGIEKGSRGVPLTKFAAASRAAKSALTPLQKTQLEKLDATIPKIFAREATPPSIPLQDLIVSQLRDRYTPGTTLNAQIDQIIRSLPREMRGPNERNIAAAIARSQSPQ